MLEKWKNLASDLIKLSLNNIFSENIELLKRLENIDIDSSITRTNKNQVAQNYRLLQEQSEAKLKDLVHSYNMYKSEPSQVSGDD